MKKKALVSLSFDDGRADNYDIIKNVTIPMNLPVTLNITTGYVDRSCPQEKLPSDKLAMTKENVIELFNNPLVEIALHGDQHLNTEKDISAGRKKLIEWFDLPYDSKFGFASPGSGFDIQEFINSKHNLFNQDILYMRTSLRISTKKKIRIFCRKVSRVIHLPFLYAIAYADTVMDNSNDRVIYSVPILKDITVLQVEAIINKCIKRGGALTLMFHSIVEDTSTDDNWSWEKEKFEAICQYLAQKQSEGLLDVCTTKVLHRSIM
ncbi:MAG: hypothetical protein J1E85_02880 [Ruminococcus sp.]|nr:hypothetical protein [Ruminococcus sp.]